jgi:hypothetical protein
MRKGERRDAWAAFLTLFGFLGSHSLLETARDALFLAKVPATRLPWVFLAIAALSLGLAHLQSRVSHRLVGRPALMVWTLAASTITFAFFLSLDSLGPSGVYALYIWSGVLTTLVLVHFWTLVGKLFSISQAKRLYGFIGAGSVLGAIAGSGTASALSHIAPPRQLVLVSACGFAVTAAFPLLFHGAAQATVTQEATPTLLDNAAYVARQPYARRVVLSMFVSSMCLTVGDYLFKSVVAELIPRAELGAFLGTAYFALNLVSLLCQLTLVGWVVRRFSLSTALAVLPALLLLGGLGVVLSGGLLAVLVIKTADGGLRYSLHRTASELLYLPFSDEARRRVKAFIDVVGQRGGQALASLSILLFAAERASLAAHGIALSTVLGLTFTALAAGWIATALALRAPYLELFRARLKTGRMFHADEFPELDVASLETLIASLDSDRDPEVIAALEVLEREQKVHLVPGLILHHPSDHIVERALDIFTRTRRRNVVHVIDRLLEHPSPRVRAATIAARSVLDPDPQRLLARMSLEQSPEVRGAITVNLIASGEIHGPDAQERIAALMEGGSAATKIALAEAIARREAPGFDDVLVALSAAPEVAVQRAAITAMGRVKSPDLLAALIQRLGEGATRREAGQVLVGYGAPGMEALVRGLADDSVARTLRFHLPHVISLFAPEPAAAALLSLLPRESEGTVRYQIIRTLERLVRRHPELSLDGQILARMIGQTLRRAYGCLDRRLILAGGVKALPSRETPGHKLLGSLLRDKQKNAIERLFRLLGLAHPREDFAQIYRGLAGEKDTRATSMELIENVLTDPLRAAVVGLVDDVPPEQQLLFSGAFHQRLDLDYEGVLADLLASKSEAVQDITVFHLGELGLTSFRERIERLPNPRGERSDLTRALTLLAASPGEPTSVAT